MKKTGIESPWLPLIIKLYRFRLRVSTIKRRSQSEELNRKNSEGVREGVRAESVGGSKSRRRGLGG